MDDEQRRTSSAFEDWVNRDWPADIPNVCTKLGGDVDCCDRESEEKCASCAEYLRRMSLWDFGTDQPRQPSTEGQGC
jgi:hypothetical protein